MSRKDHGFFPYNARKTEIEGIKIKYWNTQRKYTPKGQRIIAAEVTLGTIYFFDLDRQIDGIMNDTEFTEDGVMLKYDSCDYYGVCNQDEYVIKNKLFLKMDEIEALFN